MMVTQIWRTTNKYKNRNVQIVMYIESAIADFMYINQIKTKILVLKKVIIIVYCFFAIFGEQNLSYFFAHQKWGAKLIIFFNFLFFKYDD